MSRWAVGVAAAVVAGVCGDAPGARAQDLWSGQADLGGTIVSRSSTASTSVRLARAQAVGVGVDRRFERLHLFARAEANAWRDRRDDGSDDFVLMFDLGVGARIDYGAGRLRSSVAAGGTVLAEPTDVDQAGTLGVFADVRPLAYAWPLPGGMRLGVVPLSFTLAIPVLTGIPLVSIQYRTTLFLEWDL